MKKTEKERPYSVTTSPKTPELTELERIKAQMISDVAVALIGCSSCYPSPQVIAKDTNRIIELCFSDWKEVEK